jgi:hypothetical protein
MFLLKIKVAEVCCKNTKVFIKTNKNIKNPMIFNMIFNGIFSPFVSTVQTTINNLVLLIKKGEKMKIYKSIINYVCVVMSSLVVLCEGLHLLCVVTYL